MTLTFNGQTYTTIHDVKERFRVAEKTVNKMIKNGLVPKPDVIVYGTRRFRHFSAEWIAAFESALGR